jgi:restriction system protein
VLIDGERLAELIIEHNLGVTRTTTYELKELSNDFLDEAEA